MSAFSSNAETRIMPDVRTAPDRGAGAPSELKGHQIRQIALAFAAVSWAAVLYAVV